MKPPIEWRPKRGVRPKPVETEKFQVANGPTLDAVKELSKRRALKAAQMQRYRKRLKEKKNERSG